MEKAQDYRRHARECRILAMSAGSDEEKKQLLAMAEGWESLARDREGFVSRHPELTRRTEVEDRGVNGE